MEFLPDWIKSKIKHLKEICYRNLNDSMVNDLDPDDYDFMGVDYRIGYENMLHENQELSQINKKPVSRIDIAIREELKERKSEEIKRDDRGPAHAESDIESLKRKTPDESSTNLQVNKSSLSLTSMCCICNLEGARIAFLCNHNYCEMCLARACCNQILSYCHQVSTSHVLTQRKFEYRCQAANCKAFISVPTRKVVKYILETQLKNDTQGFKLFFEYVLENQVAFYDGITSN